MDELEEFSFKNKNGILKIDHNNYKKKYLNILESFHEIVILEDPTFKIITEDKLRSEDTEVYILIKDYKPIGYAYWNKAFTNMGEIDCIRQLYILPGFRKQGNAKNLLYHKIESIESFISDSPTYITAKLLKIYFKNKYKGYIICP